VLYVFALSEVSPSALDFALAVDRVDPLDLDAKHGSNCLLDFSLVGPAIHHEGVDVLILDQLVGLLRHNGSENY